MQINPYRKSGNRTVGSALRRVVDVVRVNGTECGVFRALAQALFFGKDKNMKRQATGGARITA